MDLTVRSCVSLSLTVPSRPNRSRTLNIELYLACGHRRVVRSIAGVAHLARASDRAGKKSSQIRLHIGLELFNKAGQHHRLYPDFDLLVPNISRVEWNAKLRPSPAASPLVPRRSGTPAKLDAYGTARIAV
jgi:hypothetical protein